MGVPISGSTGPLASCGQISKTLSFLTRRCLPLSFSIEARTIPKDCLITDPNGQDQTCSSSQWPKIKDYLSLVKQIIPLSYKNEFLVAQGPIQIDLTDRASIRNLILVEDETFLSSGPRPLLATTQHVAISNALTNTGSLWALALTNVTAQKGHGSPLSDQSDAIHSISHDYQQPYNSVVCIPDSARSIDDPTPIGVPYLPNANSVTFTDGNSTYDDCFSRTQVTARTKKYPLMTRGQMFNSSKPSSHFGLQWLALDRDLLEGSSLGAIVMLPKTTANDTQNVLICKLSAG